MKLTKERIVDAGMAVFAEVGYHNLSMRQVADRLDAHAGSLYYHVRGKDELLTLMADRVCRQAYDTGTAALAALPPTPPGGTGSRPRPPPCAAASSNTPVAHCSSPRAPASSAPAASP